MLKKRLFCTFLAVVFTLTAAVLPVCAGVEVQAPEEYYTRFMGKGLSINVYNWGEYISDGTDGSVGVNEEFTKLTGIKVNYVNYSTNEELYSKLRGGGAVYDVIIPSDYMIGRMISEGMLEPLNFENIPNFKFIDENFKTPIYDPQNRFSVPYTWGMVGIIYNTEMVDEEDAQSWDILWDERYLGQILMFSNPRDAFAVAEKRKGYSANTTDPDELQDCLESLKEQKLLVQAYVMDEIFDKMLGGEAALAPYYAGDAFTMIAENESLAFAIPKEGTNIFVDAACIPKGARNKEAAEMYINFLCEPEIAAANSEYIGYAVPNPIAQSLLDEEVAQSPVAYPPLEIQQMGEYFSELPRETNLLMDQMWTELLSTDEQYNRMLVPVLLVAAILFSFGLNIYRTVKKKKQKKYF